MHFKSNFHLSERFCLHLLIQIVPPYNHLWTKNPECDRAMIPANPCYPSIYRFKLENFICQLILDAKKLDLNGQPCVIRGQVKFSSSTCENSVKFNLPSLPTKRSLIHLNSYQLIPSSLGKSLIGTPTFQNLEGKSFRLIPFISYFSAL